MPRSSSHGSSTIVASTSMSTTACRAQEPPDDSTQMDTTSWSTAMKLSFPSGDAASWDYPDDDDPSKLARWRSLGRSMEPTVAVFTS